MLVVLSILVVVFFSYLCCNYTPAESLLGLFLVEWLIVLVVWHLLCPWLGYRSVLLPAVIFLLSLFISVLVTRESVSVYGTVWGWSDDYWYLGQAGCVVDSLRSSGWNLLEAWTVLTLVASWTLAGWPFVLGLVSSFVTSDISFEMLHAVALSLNATFLALVLAFIFHILDKPARRFPWMVLFCFLLLIGDPIVYATMSLKETMLQLSLMSAFVACVKLSKRIQLPWLIVGLLGLLGVATTRTAYIPLMLLVLFWNLMDRIRLGTYLKVVLGLIIIASFSGLILGFNIREVSVAELIGGRTLEAEAGLAISVYNIPFVGPTLYYAISPVPPLPWKILSQEQIITTLIRSAGSVAWFFAACYVLRGLIRNRLLLKDGLFGTATIMFLGLFIAVVLTGDDPRYKQPTNFFLAIMLFLTWHDSRILRSKLFSQ